MRFYWALIAIVSIAACSSGGDSASPEPGGATNADPTQPLSVLSLTEDNTYMGRQIANIVAEGHANDPFWNEYWDFNAREGWIYDTQREIDDAWRNFGGIPFKPQPDLCKQGYQSPFENSVDRPQIQLLGSNVIDLSPGMPYIEAGFTAMDKDGLDISSQVVVEGLNLLDTNTEGNYLLTYHVQDANGVAAQSLGRMVRVFITEPQIETLRLKRQSIAPMNYVTVLPPSYGDAEDNTYPVVIHFHGWSGSEDFGELAIPTLGGTALAIQQTGSRPWPGGPEFLVFQPQRSRVLFSDIFASSINNPSLRDACETRRFVDYVVQHYKVDPKRIYFVGFSNGVLAVTEYLRTFNDRASAALLLAGAGWLQPICDFAHIPYWALMGSGDDNGERPQALARITHEQSACPGNFPKSKFTMIPGLGHLSAPMLNNSNVGNWDPDFDPYDITVWEWLLQFENDWLNN